MTSGWFVTASDIKHWTETNKRRAEELLPMLVRKMIYASCKPEHLHFPSGDSVAIGGWDGTLEVDEGNEFVPTGKSVWEFGTNRSVKTKADGDYQKRTDNPGDITPPETTYVSVTSRTWQYKDDWCSEKNSEGVWQQVTGINADDLEHWLQQCSGIHRWFANLIGKRVDSVWDIEQAWGSWTHSTSTPTTFELVHNGRVDQSEELSKFLKGNPAIIRIKASSEDEAYAFGLATLIQNEELAPRVLVIKDQNQWDILLDTQNTLILMPQNFSPANIGYAKQRGHFVIIPVDASAPRTASKEIQLGKMSKDDVINALQSMGLDKDQAEEIYVDTRGYLGPIRRHEMIGPQENIIPAWVDQFDANILVSALFASEWDNRKEKDKEAVSALAGVPYEQVEEKLFELASAIESPIRLVGNIWQVISKIDFWSLTAHKINKQSIERLQPIVLDALGEIDPSFDLSPNERWLANIKDAVPEHSGVLKSGIADTMLLIAVFGDGACQNLGEIKLADRVAYWVRELLNKDISARGWYSFGHNLIYLAEAAPDHFLQALENSMQGSEPPIGPIFVEEGDFGGCPHSNLLWALETLSWSIDYLPRVTQALARLSEIDPGGKYNNRPSNSLRDIFLGWINNTRATHQERLQILDANLIKFYPEGAWRLLIRLLPERSGGISTPIHKPYCRDWAEGIKKEVTNRDYYPYVEGVADRLLNLVDEEPQLRWPELLDSITRLTTKRQFNETIDKLLSVNLDELGDEVRLKIADKLRNTISRHREFEDAKWAWPKETIDRLEEAFHFVLPEDPILKNRHLFDGHLPELINPIVRGETNYQERYDIIDKYRQDALNEIYQKSGIDGIQQLSISCGDPGFIGHAVANSDLRASLENEILTWLESEEDGLLFVARSFVSACANIDKGWLKNVTEQSGSWSNDKFTNFLLGLPFSQDTFEVLCKAEIEIQKQYWEKVNYYFLHDKGREKGNWVVEQLFLNGRPLAAIDAAAHVLHGSPKESLDCHLLGDVLKKIVVDPSDKEKISISNVRYDILKTIEYIQDQEELTRAEIAQIEWMYLRILRFESVKPRYLEEDIINNPAFFAQLVSWLFKPDKGEREVEDIDEESLKNRAENAWELLRTISVLPGRQDDGSVDSEKLREWVLRAREQLDLAGRKKIGDDQIGQILSKSSPGADGIWPHEAVRDLIEELQCRELEEAMGTGIRNSRGVTTRSPYEGGGQERELAKKYREQAQKIKLQWPRTSELLRRLERSYEREADWEDRGVELRT